MKNLDNKILIIAASIIGFFGGIAFVNNWLVLNKNYPHITMFDIPLQADVWGTVSDWVMIVVTAFTAYYLVKSFREQKIITQLEQKRFLDSYLPILEVINIVYTNIQSVSKTEFNIIIKSNSLQNLRISHNFPDSFNITVPYVINNVMIAKEKKLSFSVSFVLEPVFIEVNEYSGNTIVFEYEDYLGNKYQQYLLFLGSDNLHMQPAFRILNS